MVDPLSGGPAGSPELLAREAAQPWVELPVTPTDDPEWIFARKDLRRRASTNWNHC